MRDVSTERDAGGVWRLGSGPETVHWDYLSGVSEPVAFVKSGDAVIVPPVTDTAVAGARRRDRFADLRRGSAGEDVFRDFRVGRLDAVDHLRHREVDGDAGERIGALACEPLLVGEQADRIGARAFSSSPTADNWLSELPQGWITTSLPGWLRRL
jgi:hypothetical protein